MPSALPKTLLLVDDDQRNLFAFTAVLERFGHRIVTAADGHEALRAFEIEIPDLVLCDLAMPGLDGIEVLRAIRSHPTRGDTPFILITAHAQREHRVRALEADADDFLEKPVDSAILLARVRTLLRLKDARDVADAAHRQLAARHGELERLQKEQRELTDFLVHDLKVPLTAMRLGLEWCREQAPTMLHGALDECASAAQRLGVQLEDLLWIARLEQPSFPVDMQRIPMRRLLDDAVARSRAAAQAKRVALAIAPAEDIDAVADPKLLHRVVQNLIENALRHTPAGGRVEVAMAREHGVALFVCNDGPPIPDSDRSRIFEKFTRSRTAGGSAGLGLYFCKRAMQAQRGDVEVVDLPGWPAAFRVWLPPTVDRATVRRAHDQA